MNSVYQTHSTKRLSNEHDSEKRERVFRVLCQCVEYTPNYLDVCFGLYTWQEISLQILLRAWKR